MDISFLTEYMVPVITGLCLCVGFIVKKWVADVDNKYIPTICAVLGVALSVWMNWPAIDASVILGGLVSGLGATGIDQLVKQIGSK